MYKVIITTQDGRTIYCKAKNTRTIIFAQLPYSFIVKHNDHPFLGQFYSVVLEMSFIFADTPEKEKFWYDIVDELRSEI